MSETALIQAAPINLDKMDKAEKQSKLVVAANEARGLAMDAIVNAGCGHFGIPLGCAEMGSIMFTSQMMYNPQNPKTPKPQNPKTPLTKRKVELQSILKYLFFHAKYNMGAFS